MTKQSLVATMTLQQSGHACHDEEGAVLRDGLWVFAGEHRVEYPPSASPSGNGASVDEIDTQSPLSEKPKLSSSAASSSHSSWSS